MTRGHSIREWSSWTGETPSISVPPGSSSSVTEWPTLWSLFRKLLHLTVSFNCSAWLRQAYLFICNTISMTELRKGSNTFTFAFHPLPKILPTPPFSMAWFSADTLGLRRRAKILWGVLVFCQHRDWERLGKHPGPLFTYINSIVVLNSRGHLPTSPPAFRVLKIPTSSEGVWDP